MISGESVLFATGYLTDAGEPVGRVHRLVIPNKEIRGIYEDKIRSWFEIKVTGNMEQWRQFCIAIKNGDAENGAFDAACREAMKQMEDGEYAMALKQEGVQTIHKYGIACYKKTCKVTYRKE